MKTFLVFVGAITDERNGMVVVHCSTFIANIGFFHEIAERRFEHAVTQCMYRCTNTHMHREREKDTLRLDVLK